MFKRLFSIVAFLSLGVAPMAACSLRTDEGESDKSVAEAESAFDFCGGIAGIQCPAGEICVDNPADGCDPNNGGADCGGICIPKRIRTCGGLLGLQCPTGYACVDDPRDDCDPENGGADCSGICVPKSKLACRLKHPQATWVSHDPEQCKLVKYACPPGQKHFSDKCGCGCEPDNVLPPIGETCGSSTCGAGTYCCNASCGICAPLDGACTQQVCDPQQ